MRRYPRLDHRRTRRGGRAGMQAPSVIAPTLVPRSTAPGVSGRRRCLRRNERDRLSTRRPRMHRQRLMNRSGRAVRVLTGLPYQMRGPCVKGHAFGYRRCPGHGVLLGIRTSTRVKIDPSDRVTCCWAFRKPRIGCRKCAHERSIQCTRRSRPSVGSWIDATAPLRIQPRMIAGDRPVRCLGAR